MAAPMSKPTAERDREALNGWLALVLVVLWFIAAIAVFLSTATIDADTDPGAVFMRVLSGLLMVVFGVFCSFGFFTLQPNEARVLILFGAYKGTARRSGFHWANPLYARTRGVVPGSTPVVTKGSHGTTRLTQPKLKTKLSLRVHNFNSQTLKVNDKRGNPVEIAAVVAWRVDDTAQAVFDVEDYESYVQ